MTDRRIADFDVRKVPRSEGREFIIEHHYSESCHAAPLIWGLYDTAHDNELIGAIAFAIPISENVRRYAWRDDIEDEMKECVTELHRLVTLDDCPHNTESWFISRALDALKSYRPTYKVVVSFADSTEGHNGSVYQASNAIYYGTTGEATFYRDDDGHLHHPRMDGWTITKDEALDRGWEPEKRGEKHRYLFLLPDEYESKDDVRDMLDINEQPYP